MATGLDFSLTYRALGISGLVLPLMQPGALLVGGACGGRGLSGHSGKDRCIAARCWQRPVLSETFFF